MDSEMKLQKLSVRARSPRTRTKMGLKNWSVKYRKCVCTPLVLGKVEFPTIWSEFRLKNQLCDGVISCDDGTVFKIHRAILSAVSPYFRVLLYNYISFFRNITQRTNKLFRLCHSSYLSISCKGNGILNSLVGVVHQFHQQKSTRNNGSWTTCTQWYNQQVNRLRLHRML